MNLKSVLKEIDFLPEKGEFSILKKETDNFVELLKKEIMRQKVDADVFVGGSYAKGTIVRKGVYDVDIFIRFDWEIDDISDPLEKILKVICKKNKLKIERVHGSRDYFKIKKRNDLVFEIVPVTRIKKPNEARNVTDLSYFHVNYVKNKIKKTDIAREIALAKTFCRAQGVYGAESYIHGFSGYGLECLVIYYRTFEKMLRSLAAAKEQVIIDIENQFKNKRDIMFELNESKLHSPIVLVDPTWKERNALAGLSMETFNKFQIAAKAFLKKPDKSFFQVKKIDESELKKFAKKINSEYLHIKIETEKQPGDIAGTKLKKFADFLSLELGKSFEMKRKEFHYDDKHDADVYFILKSKKEIIRIGPPVKLQNHSKAFKKANKSTFVKNGMLHARIKIDFTARDFVKNYAKSQNKKLKEMGITKLNII